MIWTEDDGKDHRPDLIVDYGVERTLLIHEGNKAEDPPLKDGTIPEPRSTDNAEFKIVQTPSSANYRVDKQIIGNVLPKRVWNFLRRPQLEFTICTKCRKYELTNKSEKG